MDGNASLTPSQEKALNILRATKFPTCKRDNVRRSDDESKHRGMCLGFYFLGRHGITTKTHKFGDLTQALTTLCDEEYPGFPFTSIQVNQAIMCAAHVDANNKGPSRMLTLGDFTGGQTWVHDEEGTVEYEVEEDVSNSKEYKKGMKLRGRVYETRNRWIHFDATRLHYTLPFQGERYTIVYFSNTHFYSCPEGLYKELMLLNFAKNSDNPHKVDAMRDVADVDADKFYSAQYGGEGEEDISDPRDAPASSNERPPRRSRDKDPVGASASAFASASASSSSTDPPHAGKAPAPSPDGNVDQDIMEQIFLEAERARNVMERDHKLELEAKDEELEQLSLRESDLSLQVGMLKEQVEKLTNENQGLNQASEENRTLRRELAASDSMKARYRAELQEKDREIRRLEAALMKARSSASPGDDAEVPGGCINDGVAAQGISQDNRSPSRVVAYDIVGSKDEDDGDGAPEVKRRRLSPSNSDAWAAEEDDRDVEDVARRNGIAHDNVLDDVQDDGQDKNTHSREVDEGARNEPNGQRGGARNESEDDFLDDLEKEIEDVNEVPEHCIQEEPSVTPEGVC